jgi:hypothetical protein
MSRRRPFTTFESPLAPDSSSAPEAARFDIVRTGRAIVRCALLAVLLATASTADAQEADDAERAGDTSDGSERADQESETRKPGGLGLAPGTLQTGNLVIGPNQPTAATNTSDTWQFQFRGYLRAPVRFGFGPGTTSKYVDEVDHGTKVHSPPQIPDGNYTDWRYTNNLSGPWSELHFSYGNDRASAHIIMGAYNFSDAGYRDLQAQLGINQAFVTLDFPRAFGRFGGLLWNVGGFANAYGAAGRYDAGRYDTYLIGRTHIAGETLTAYLDVLPDLRLTIEHGIGVKLQAPPFSSSDPVPPYLPYPGPVQQGTTLVHHAHLGATYKDKATLSAHYLTTWTDDAQNAGEVDGRITVLGMDLKLTGGIFGDGYIGYSHVESRNILRLQQSLELLHSFSGWSLRDNYFPGSNTGTGSIDSVLFQYTYSLATLLRHPEPFWGQGPDIVLGLFGTISWVSTDEVLAEFAKTKAKFGADVTYTMLEWLGASLRADLVNPDMDNNTKSFSVISPRLIFRTQFVTHEQVVLSYTRYFYGDNVAASWPNAQNTPDLHALSLTASMWW